MSQKDRPRCRTYMQAIDLITFKNIRDALVYLTLKSDTGMTASEAPRDLACGVDESGFSGAGDVHGVCAWL